MRSTVVGLAILAACTQPSSPESTPPKVTGPEATTPEVPTKTRIYLLRAETWPTGPVEQQVVLSNFCDAPLDYSFTPSADEADPADAEWHSLPATSRIPLLIPRGWKCRMRVDGTTKGIVWTEVDDGHLYLESGCNTVGASDSPPGPEIEECAGNCPRTAGSDECHAFRAGCEAGGGNMSCEAVDGSELERCSCC